MMRRTWLVASAALAAASCVKKIDSGRGDVEIDTSIDDPEQAGERNVQPYNGGNTYVLDAQERLYTANDLHTKVLRRSCSGLPGNCHNSKEFPDMRTPETFLATIGSRCNVNVEFYGNVFDGCETDGDTFYFESQGAESGDEIAYAYWIAGEPTEGEPGENDPGLHVILREGVAAEQGRQWRNAIFIRDMRSEGGTRNQIYAEYEQQWWVASSTHLVAEVPEFQTENVAAIVSGGIRQGDANRNGIYGASQANEALMINPGLPEASYLVGRLVGALDGDAVPGTRMPLANLPPTIPDMLALMCFIEGLPTDGSPVSMSWPIDYRNCSYSDDPESLALDGISGASWSERVWPLLQSNCGGCHGGANPLGDFDVLANDTYDNLLAFSKQNPSLRMVDPGNSGASYLWLKLIGDPGITGDPMPQDPVEGYIPLGDQALQDIQSWIDSGALED